MQTQRKIFNARPLFYGFLSLLLAISATRFLFAANWTYLSLILVVFVLFLGYAIWKKRFVSLIVVVGAFLFGIGWYFVGITSFQGKTYDEVCQVEGRVGEGISYYAGNAYVLLKNVEINGKSEKNINLRIYLSDDTEIKEGDIYRFKAEIENIKPFELGTFNSTAYRNNASYNASVDVQSVDIVGNKLTFDESLRYSIREMLNKSMGETYGPVAYAVLFGNKDDVDSTFKDIFKMAGVVHILTVSGLHVSFLIALIGWILKKCHVRGWLNFVICATFLGIYAYLCGFSPSVVRAGIMGLVLLVTKISGKCYDPLNSLALSGIFILAIKPLSALDVGFLMSFFCVLGIFVVSPWLGKIFRKFLPKGIADSFAISISASIGILPAMSSIFGHQNFLSFFSNLIVVPIFSVVYPLLFVFAFLATLMPWLSFMLDVCTFGLDIIFNISAFFANTSFYTILWPMAGFVSLGIFLAMFLASRYSMLGKRVKIICCSALLAFSCVFAFVNNDVSPDVGVAYCFDYKYDTIMLTNSKGKTAIVDLSMDERRLMSLCNVKQVSTFFVLDDKISDIDSLREVGMQNIVSCNSSRDYDEEVLVESNVGYQIDGFEFEYKKFDKVIYALEISFDETSVLILNKKEALAEHVATLAKDDYDFVMLGTRTEFAKYFSAGCVVQGYGDDDGVDKNYLQNGNSFYKINENDYVWRCLD